MAILWPILNLLPVTGLKQVGSRVTGKCKGCSLPSSASKSITARKMLVKTLSTHSLFPNYCFHTASAECVNLFTIWFVLLRDTIWVLESFADLYHSPFDQNEQKNTFVQTGKDKK